MRENVFEQWSGSLPGSLFLPRFCEQVPYQIAIRQKALPEYEGVCSRRELFLQLTDGLSIVLRQKGARDRAMVTKTWLVGTECPFSVS